MVVGGGVVDHQGLGVANFQVHHMPDNPDAQVSKTLGIMGERVREDSKDPAFIQRALSLGLQAPTQQETCERVWAHVKRSIKFQRDEVTGDGVGGWGQGDVIEVIIRPVDMARYVDQGIATGDCDDFSMYQAALLTALNVPCSFITVAADSRDPNQFSHVYVIAYPERQRLALDASHGEYPGWETRNLGRTQEWDCQGGNGLFKFAATIVGSLTGMYLWNRYQNQIRGVLG